ncbi:MAG: DUF4058 family protein [Lyngbya sp.]|nr:DUF4058 family protein [Lyngbya sp.]
MASPFPGMNPYLEHPQLWPEVHHRLITAIAIAIQPPLLPKYRVAIEKRTYLSIDNNVLMVGIPDLSVVTTPSSITPQQTETSTSEGVESVTVTLPMPVEVQEGYLEVREMGSGRVVTVIEVLSPTNKRPGRGKDDYEQKRLDILSSSANLVEIDLLRDGKSPQILSAIPQTDYRILIARRRHRPQAELLGFSIRQAIPAFKLPLKPGESEPFVSLQDLLQEIYEQAGFDLAIDYTREPFPSLKEDDRIWTDALLRQQKRREAL